MISHLAKAKELLKKFKECCITQILMAENINVDSLARLASVLKSKLIRTIPLETLKQPSILKEEEMSKVRNKAS